MFFFIKIQINILKIYWIKPFLSGLGLIQWWANIIKWTQTKIRIYSDAASYTKQISEYTWMPHYVPRKYPNILKCHIFTKQISEYICTPEIAPIQIRIIFQGHFIRIFEYSYCLKTFLKRAHSCFLLIKYYTWYFLMHKVYLDFLF